MNGVWVEMYIIDSNVFMQAANSYYAFDIFPAFWAWIAEHLGDELFTVSPVKDEILKQNDDLADWFRGVDDPSWVLSVDGEGTQLEMPIIAQHCVGYGYKPAGIAKFLSGADPWVIARARQDGFTVVTQEIPQPETRKRVKIPDVCMNVGVEQIIVFDLLRRLEFSA